MRSVACAQRAVEEWNSANGPGTPVVRVDDIGREHRTKTRSMAWVCSGVAVVMVEGVAGGCDLRRIRRAEDG